MRLRRARTVNGRVRIAFLGAGVGLHSEGSDRQGLPMLLALLTRLAVDFDLVLYSLIRVNASSVPKGIRLRQITSLKLPSHVKYMLLVITFVFDHLRRPFAIINAISAFPAGRIAVILGAVFRRPAIVHLIGSETVMIPDIGYGDLLKPRLRKIVGWVCKKADVLIVQTEYQRKLTEGNLQLGREITLLSQRVEVTMFPFRERSISFPVKFLHVASFQPVKDQETLFRAFAKIGRQVECRLTVVGEGFNDTAVQQMLIDLEIENKVKCVGLVKHDEIWHHFQDADILLHSSRYESLCGAVMEAMASGVPVCGTAVGILADLGDPFAMIASPHDPDELANCSLALIRDAERYHRQQRLARDYVMNHDAASAAKNYKDLFMNWIK